MTGSKFIIILAEAELPLFVGIDVGGTSIKLGLLDNRGRTLAYHSIPTEQDRGAEDSVVRLAQGVEQLIAKAGTEKSAVARIGLATPGPMDIAAGMILRPGNLPGWWDFPIREALAGAVCQRCQRRGLRRVLAGRRQSQQEYGAIDARHGDRRRDRAR
jgi:glucokinase